MLSIATLKQFAREGARILAAEADLAQFELYCSSAEQLVMRLNYTSDIPSSGVEECKSLGADGFAIRIVPRRDRHEIGSSFIAGDLSGDAVREALARARRAAVIDPHSPGLPETPRRLKLYTNGAGGDLMRAGSARLVETAWEIVDGAMRAFARQVAAGSERQGLIVGGDLSLTRDRFAVASSNFDEVRAEQAAYFSSSVTAIIEALDTRSTTTALGASMTELRRTVPSLGRDAVRRAFALTNGERPTPGRYRVVLGRQPIAEILCYLLVPSLTTGAFHASNSAYHGRFDDRVMDERLSIADEPAARGRAIARRLTCEGLPARRSQLIRDGRLVGLLSNFYDAQRLAHDEHRREKLGPKAPADPLFHAANGYRLGEGGGRRFDSAPAAAATNVVMRARGGVSERELIGAVGNGIYVGRVWYTYPINGQRAGDFTCTITGDSYLIRNGRIAAPLRPNTLRINANLDEIFRSPVAIGKRLEPVTVWGASEMFYVPALAAEAVSLSSVVGAGE
ncbi:MAG TPA: metallopeptidase TldD-related protein [Candidatus Binataceae bacterium]|nr:metallopeptidase TldD-related protein [Candidatus Binataceae bacterium]